MRLSLLAAALLLTSPVQAGEVSAKLRVVSDVPEMEGKQVQSPVWAPASSPRLVHEMTDRDKTTLLRILRVDGADVKPTQIPGARSGRLESLGAGAERADTGAAWWDEGSLFFVRALGGKSSLHYFDGVPREVTGLPGRVLEVATDQGRGHLFVTMEDAGGLDLHRLSGEGFTQERRRLTRTQHEVENSLSIDPRTGQITYVRTSSDRTRLGHADVEDLAGEEGPNGTGLGSFELLSVAKVSGEDAQLMYARTPAGAPDEGSSHVLLQLSGGEVTVLAPGVFLPPGLAPAPAVSHDGTWVYYVLSDAAGGNPIRRVNRRSGKSEAVQLGTRFNQEIAVAGYKAADGTTMTWIAVVAVGDADGEDVRNHLYMGPLGSWPGW
jgi:hypothetical protein